MRPIVTDRVAWSVCHTSEPCKNGWTDRDAIWIGDSTWLREPCIRSGLDPHGQGQLWGGKGRPIVKYRDTLQSSVQKRQNRSRCCLGCGLRWAQGSHALDRSSDSPMGRGNFGQKGHPQKSIETLCSNLCEYGWIDCHAVWIMISEWPKGSRIRWGPDPPWEGAILGERITDCKV